MAKHGFRTSKKTLAKRSVSAKVATVKRDSPGLTNRQAVGKATGILRGKKRR